MLDTIPSDPGRAIDTTRTPAQRSADHAAIERLAVQLLPALMAKLAATGLGELEVREGDWRVRLRRPVEGAPGRDRRSTDRDRERGGRGAGAASAGHAGHAGHAGPPGSRRSARAATAARRVVDETAGTDTTAATAVAMAATAGTAPTMTT